MDYWSVGVLEVFGVMVLNARTPDVIPSLNSRRSGAQPQDLIAGHGLSPPHSNYKDIVPDDATIYILKNIPKITSNLPKVPVPSAD